MTLKKIADHSGVSVSTVSKVMHGSKEISEETAATVKMPHVNSDVSKNII